MTVSTSFRRRARSRGNRANLAWFFQKSGKFCPLVPRPLSTLLPGCPRSACVNINILYLSMCDVFIPLLYIFLIAKYHGMYELLTCIDTRLKVFIITDGYCKTRGPLTFTFIPGRQMYTKLGVSIIVVSLCDFEYAVYELVKINSGEPKIFVQWEKLGHKIK